MYDTRQNAAKALMEVYRQRKDLQRSFPEVESGDHSGLIQWAAGVCALSWFDPALSVLHQYAEWYSPASNLHLDQDRTPAAILNIPNQTEENLPSVANGNLQSSKATDDNHEK